MDKKDIIAYFDQHAAGWDAGAVHNTNVINTILDNAGVCPGVHVLDVACGTGVMFPFYRQRQVASVTGIDIAPEMVKIARSKYPDTEVICGDVEQTAFDRTFDIIMVYNAFPHFPDPAALLSSLAGCLRPGGRLCVAHGLSREALNRHHDDHASAVSLGLLHEQELAELFSRWFEVDVVISNESMYQVSGILRKD